MRPVPCHLEISLTKPVLEMKQQTKQMSGLNAGEVKPTCGAFMERRSRYCTRGTQNGGINADLATQESVPLFELQ